MNRNAIIISLGGVNAASLGCYGNGWIETPNLDRLAAEGFVFDQCFSDGPCPLAAQQAWWTGRHQFFDAVRQSGDGVTPSDYPAAQQPTLANLLRLDGIRAALVRVSGKTGGESTAADAGFAPTVDVEVTATGSVEPLFVAAQQWLHQEAEKAPFLLFLDCRTENGLPKSNDAFEQAITGLDARIGSFLDEVRGSGAAKQTLIVVTSDFGQPTGETAAAGRSQLHEERVHVPLILCWPEVTEPASRSHALVEAVDVMPTILDAFGVAAPPQIDGRSLLPIVRFEQRKLRDHARMGIAGREFAVRTAEWHLIVPQAAPDTALASEPQLYVKPDDRWERNDVARLFPDVVRDCLLAIGMCGSAVDAR